MTITELKQLRSYAEKINDYEFDNLTGVKTTYTWFCILSFATIIGLLTLILVKSANAPIALPEAKKRVVSNTIRSEVTGELVLEDNHSVSYDRYWGKTR